MSKNNKGILIVLKGILNIFLSNQLATADQPVHD